jgi:hypothetical protein
MSQEKEEISDSKEQAGSESDSQESSVTDDDV